MTSAEVWRGGLVAACLTLSALASQRPFPQLPWQSREFAQPTQIKVDVQVADANGRPLAKGTKINGRIFYVPASRKRAKANSNPFLFAMHLYPFRDLVIGDGGALEFADVVSTPAAKPWIHLRLDPKGGRRQRVLVPVKDGLNKVRLAPERLLASGAIRDEQGTALLVREVQLRVKKLKSPFPDPFDPLGARWVQQDGSYELWGWPAGGLFELGAKYYWHGPDAFPVTLAIGAKDQHITLPATGCLQCKTATPQHFPMRAAYVAFRDIDRKSTLRHWVIPNNISNLRVRTGRYQVHVELNGVKVLDLGKQVIAYKKTNEVALDLRKARVFAIDVVDPKGNPIRASRVKVIGSSDEPASRQRLRSAGTWRSATLVATMQASVDLEVYEFGTRFEKRVVKGVDGDRVIVLQPKKK